MLRTKPVCSINNTVERTPSVQRRRQPSREGPVSVPCRQALAHLSARVRDVSGWQRLAAYTVDTTGEEKFSLMVLPVPATPSTPPLASVAGVPLVESDSGPGSETGALRKLSPSSRRTLTLSSPPPR